MLFKQKILEDIKSGKITLVFRKWKKPAVKKGSLIKTSVGQVEITDISEIRQEELSDSDAVNSGFEGLKGLLENLNSLSEGNIYKIGVRYHSPDPRIALRKRKNISGQEFEFIQTKLQRLDQYSKHGAWTIAILKSIRENPRLRAADLALKTQREKEWLKLNIRKLKNLGLTISHHPGYTLSPLGEEVLDKLLRM